MSAAKRRWSFRTRLTSLIAVVFVAGGVGLLGVQYLLVQGLFDSAIGDINSCTIVDGVPVRGGAAVDPSSCNAPVGQGEIAFAEQGARLSQEVLSGLLFWSLVTLAVFTAAAVFVASWLSRRSFARIGQITEATQRITRDDLHERLDLPGPNDEIKELGDTIDGMLDRLDAAFTHQERFIMNASHELRTPLATTRTALEIPLVQGHVPEHLEPAIRRALDANRRSERLVTALLQLAQSTKVQSQRGVLAGEATPGRLVAVAPLVPLLEDGLDRSRARVAERHLSVTQALSPAAVSGIDEHLLTLAIDNLIANAINHNVEGGTVSVACGEQDARAWLEIANTGAVYDAQQAARLIEPFNRGHHTRTTGAGGSVGLGLTLVQDIADAVGARFTLSPRPGGGLVARLDFS